MRPGNFTYEVVTSNGAAVHGRAFKRVKDARAAMERITAGWGFPAVFEIQRVRHLPHGSRQYDMRQRSRWVPWDHRRGPEIREPDWSVTTPCPNPQEDQ